MIDHDDGYENYEACAWTAECPADQVVSMHLNSLDTQYRHDLLQLHDAGLWA